MTNGTRLTGLEGTNPLGFMASLGVQAAFAGEETQPRLWWSHDITPHAVVDGDFGVERIADQALAVAGLWNDSAAANPERGDGTPIPKGDELKLAPHDIREYLSRSSVTGTAHGLATSLVAEGSLDNNGIAKPSDLYFAAGSQKLLNMVRSILGAVTREELVTGLTGPWDYASLLLPSLGWDVVDDRIYALRAENPQVDKKLTNPGPEALAILGLSRHPVFAGSDRTLTQGCSGSWKAGFYSWPLWDTPATPNAVKSLLAHGYDPSGDRTLWFRSWGVVTILRSRIRRSSQGGYGTFGPPEIVWQESRSRTG